MIFLALGIGLLMGGLLFILIGSLICSDEDIDLFDEIYDPKPLLIPRFRWEEIKRHKDKNNYETRKEDKNDIKDNE